MLNIQSLLYQYLYGQFLAACLSMVTADWVGDVVFSRKTLF